jgi:hypothetical protein
MSNLAELYALEGDYEKLNHCMRRPLRRSAGSSATAIVTQSSP